MKKQPISRSDLVVGDAELGELIGKTPAAIAVMRIKGQPLPDYICKAWRCHVYDRSVVEAYIQKNKEDNSKHIKSLGWATKDN